MAPKSLHVDYATVPKLIELVTYIVESISLGFDRWDEPYVRGPSLYFVIVSGTHAREYADPLGENTWPVDVCRVVTEDLDSFVAAAESVAFERDGAVIVSADGTIQKQMVRIKSPGPGTIDDGDEIEYADWMGTKHLSAVESSVREEVLAAVTLSEETGRVTVFEDGEFMDFQRGELGGLWRPNG
ncbi:diadenylate cyclase [Salinigranum salinum]|uniref:diadenylate cyclase n=1 Tax=Salinigranum salinum TaxID=1364937 RepID=UPI001260BB41|nr:diadenylate cyclase [Salinigranum salinum]